MTGAALLTRRAAADEALRLTRLADGADAPACNELRARAIALVAEYDLDWIDVLPRPQRVGHPLRAISAGRIDADLGAVRRQICRYVRRAIERELHPDADEERLRTLAIGARWRRGSNSWRPETMRALRDERVPFEPCPNCGADGENLSAADGHEVCPACRTSFLVGDYAWDNLVDVLRYGRDMAAGEVEDHDRCRRCDRFYDPAMADVHLRQAEPFCSSVGCPWGGDLPLYNPFAEPAEAAISEPEQAPPTPVFAKSRRRGTNPPDRDRVCAALTGPVRLQLLRAIARGVAWVRPETPAGAPAGFPTSDAAAPACAAASITRPIGPLRSGQSTSIDPGA